MPTLGKQSVGVEAIQNFAVKHITFDADIAVGTLFALDATSNKKGKVAGADLDETAVGIVYEGSKAKFGAGYSDEPNRPLYAGQGINVYATYVLDLGENTFTDDEVAKRIPIYEGLAGAWTKVETRVVGERVRKIGFPINRNQIWFDFTIDPVGTVNP